MRTKVREALRQHPKRETLKPRRPLVQQLPLELHCDVGDEEVRSISAMSCDTTQQRADIVGALLKEKAACRAIGAVHLRRTTLRTKLQQIAR